MPISQRRDIVNLLVTDLKDIDGGVSTFDATYTYNTNLFNNVFRRLKFIDEVNDFPSVYINADEEQRFYQSREFTTSILTLVIRCYIRDEDNQDQLENIIQDIEHVLNNSSSLLGDPDKNILDVRIESIQTDEGLLKPFGLAEIFVGIQYQLT